MTGISQCCNTLNKNTHISSVGVFV
jgi:hypothetical protein